MPIGPYDDWDSCIAAQQEKGHDQESAERICGAIERDSKQSAGKSIRAKAGLWQTMADDGLSTIYLYGDVGSNHHFEVNPNAFRKELEAAESDRVRLRMNSYGGCPFAGFALFNTMRESGKTFECVNDGVVASAMTLPFAAGDTRRMAVGSQVMIHRPTAMMRGNADDFDSERPKQKAASLRDTELAALDRYMAITGQGRDEIMDMMKAETWLGPTRAKNLGFATDIADMQAMSVDVNHLFSFGYEHIPEDLPVHSNLDRIENEWSSYRFTRRLEACHS